MVLVLVLTTTASVVVLVLRVQSWSVADDLLQDNFRITATAVQYDAKILS